MNGLFHGLDFHRLQSGAALFSFGAFLYALAVMMVWAFALGAIYGWLQSRSVMRHDARRVHRRPGAWRVKRLHDLARGQT